MMLIWLQTTASGPLYEGFGRPREELIWSQAFYYGIWAAILYFVDASLMVITFYGASVGHYPNDFNLTPSQRTLMLQTIMFLLYLLVGAVVFSNIENWNYLDTVYWADVTLFTVGFGDFTAQTNLGRALMMPYALVGVISLGLVIGSIRSLVLERGKKQVDARMEEKKRRRIVRTMTKKGKDEVLEPIREPRRQDSMVSQGAQSNNQLPATEYERRKAEFDLMRKIQAQTSYRRRWVAMGISTGVWLILWLLGAYIFVKCEEDYQGWKYFDGFYFCFVSLTTIGYGDSLFQTLGTPLSNLSVMNASS
uniref:Potassium channel domain-containing protein n=1 Tax=Fusarium oxysporum (strain Fo5176) TaxID=660025 RepID=A0A0D2XPX1_FUSOF